MTRFTPLSTDTAGADARPILEAVKDKYGFVPNLIGNMAHAPQAARGYLALGELVDGTRFDAIEQQVILLAVSRYNGCEYCVGAHSALAAMQQVPADVVAAIRDDKPIGDQKLEALRVLTTKIVDRRGWLSDGDVAAFVTAGYDKSQILDVVLAVAMKTISNYTNHIAGTELDPAFADFAWRAPSSEVA